jgi:uncharacterized Zn finger protein
MVDNQEMIPGSEMPAQGCADDEQRQHDLNCLPRARRAARGWWVGRWMRTLGQIFDATRLAAGRALAQERRILDMEVQLGLVTARVQADSPEIKPYRVQITFATFSDAQWDRVMQLMGERAIYAAQMMNDELPEEIESVFRSAGVSLYPSTLPELGATCTCSDWANTCQHRAAVCYLLGEWFDRDPFMLFTLRGRTRPEVIAALRVHRASQAAGADAEADERAIQGSASDPHLLPVDPEQFWQLAEELHSIEIHVAPAENTGELLQILERLPSLQDEGTRRKLNVVYRQVSRRALDTAGAQHEGDTVDAEGTAGVDTDN